MKKANTTPNPESLCIAVGTESEQKLGYVQEVLTELRVPATLIPCKVSSGVAEQPLSSAETLTGAFNRAQAALEAVDAAEYAIGLEVGYDQSPEDSYAIFCWAVVLNRKGEATKARSHAFQLPRFHTAVLQQGDYLGQRVREYFTVSPDPVTQYVAEAVRGRRLFITESLRYALIYALHREYYTVS